MFKVFQGTAHESVLAEMMRCGVQDSQYRLKTSDTMNAGPYAMLVRAVALQPKKIGNHDYLGLPEIIEDICNGYELINNASIREVLQKALVPKIVKFWTVTERADCYIGNVLYYLYLSARNQALCTYANACFNGNNQAVPPENILGVEVVTGYEPEEQQACSTTSAVSGVTFAGTADGGLVLQIGIGGD